MRVCIHRGTEEIGGSCIEIESSGQRIVLDVGLPLNVGNTSDIKIPPVKGFIKADPSLLGVVISHSHLDHYGLAHRLPPQTTFLIGAAARKILAAATLFSPAGLKLDHTIDLVNRQPIVLGPFTITPFLADHSAYDSYAILVEADGRNLFYSGDLRGHGRKGSLFEKLLRQPPERVDVLLMEGTTIGRIDSDKGFTSESNLESSFVKLIKQTSGMVLVWCSGQNIDRIVTVFRACKKANRQFIMDMYTAHILRATGNLKLPQANWDRVRVFLPSSQRIQIKAKKAFAIADSFKPYRIYPESLQEAAASSVMLFRPSMMKDIEEAQCLAGARVIYSLWSGYLKDGKNADFMKWVDKHNIQFDECHTSGHASVKDLKRLRKVFNNAPVVPIHTEHSDQFEKLFGNVQRKKDGEWWHVDVT